MSVWMRRGRGGREIVWGRRRRATLVNHLRRGARCEEKPARVHFGKSLLTSCQPAQHPAASDRPPDSLVPGYFLERRRSCGSPSALTLIQFTGRQPVGAGLAGKKSQAAQRERMSRKEIDEESFS